MQSVKTPHGVERVRATLRRIAFEQLYSHFAWSYDWVSRTFFLGQWRVWQRAALRFINGPRVLEVGIGTGNLQADLIRAGFDTWGMDLSPQMLRIATRKARRRGIHLKACRAKSQALPFPGECFDSVVSTFPSDYIIHPITLGELSRVLKPGGRLIVVPGGWLHKAGPRSRVLETISEAVYGDKSGGTGIDSDQASVKQRIEASGWIGLLLSGMERSGFAVTTRLLSNSAGSTVVVLGEKAPGV